MCRAKSEPKLLSTYCPKNAFGGITCHLRRSVKFEIFKTHNCTVGLGVPGYEENKKRRV